MGFLCKLTNDLSLWMHSMTTHPTDAAWLAFGFFGTALFGSRFVVQWIMSEMRGRSVMPIAFWYFSLAGGVVTLVYAIHIKNPPFILGQAVPLVIYGRNLWLVYRERQRDAAAS
jgi:lipid-A-disaccharide synthase-like uncharacterized protein